MIIVIIIMIITIIIIFTISLITVTIIFITINKASAGDICITEEPLSKNSAKTWKTYRAPSNSSKLVILNEKKKKQVLKFL